MRPRTAILSGTLVLISAPLLAETLHHNGAPMLAIHAECVRSLRDAGYTQIRMLQWERNRFSAYDADGSEVVLVLSPGTGGVVSQEYVHYVDR